MTTPTVELVPGDDFSLTVTLTDSDGNAIDYSGWSVHTAQITWDDDTTTDLDVDLSNADTGVFVLTCADTETDGKRLGLVHELRLKLQLGAGIEKTVYYAEVKGVKTLTSNTATGFVPGLNAEQVKEFYEANSDTNAFTDAEKSKLAGIASGAEVNTVDSVNGLTGAVVLDPDDLDDTATTNKFTTAANISKLAGIEASADVTDAANVAAAGAVMDGDFATNGLMKRTGVGTYDIVTDNSVNWNTAYGWGDHAIEGYLTSVAVGDLTDWPASVSTTEIGYLDGVTSAIQTQLNAKASLSGATFTGSISTASVDLNAIYETKSVNVVDVFVYDTSRDSDGGAWRKRCQHTSWYNETLNTATRGSRREFPAVAVIVAEATKVTIYDGDDPSLPMWMVFNTNSGWAYIRYFAGTQITAVSAKNGCMVVTSSAATGASIETNFIADAPPLIRVNINSGKTGGNIAGRNTLYPYKVDASVANIVNRSVNDVAMTVLPGAPIDPATGLPVPTIAVATNGGVSVITDSGAVYDSAKTTGATEAAIDGGRLRIAFTDSDVLAYDLASISADGFSGDIYDPATTPALLGTTTTLAKDASGSSSGLTLLDEDEATPANGMIARVTSSYNSGYQNGDIKGAFLADTDDTDLVGSGELVTNGDFATNDDTGWTRTADFGWDFSSGAAAHTGATGGRIRQAITTVSGKRYALQFDLDATGDVSLENTSIGIRNSTDTSFIASLLSGNLTANAAASHTLYFTATSTTHYVAFYTQDDVSIDNISVKLADADRSVNNKGLIVNGTVTRTPVATGAELVGYSGFSASNYLEQPYNADLDFGTGDFCLMGWLAPPVAGVGRPLFSKGPLGSNPSPYFEFQLKGDNTLSWVGNNSTTKLTTSVLTQGVYFHAAFVRISGVGYLYLNGALQQSSANTDNYDHSNTDILRFGYRHDGAAPPFTGSLALWRISATAPTADQIKKIYEDEKVLFQENAACTLYGASDAVTALAHDPVTDLLHVGSSAGRSVFKGLRRVDNTTDAVTTAISASNGLVVDQ